MPNISSRQTPCKNEPCDCQHLLLAKLKESRESAADFPVPSSTGCVHTAPRLLFCLSASPAFFRAEDDGQSLKDMPPRLQKLPGNPGQVQYSWKRSCQPSKERAAPQPNRAVVTVLQGHQCKHGAGTCPPPQMAPSQSLPQPRLLSRLRSSHHSSPQKQNAWQLPNFS